MVKIGLLKEKGDERVALVPAAIKKIIALGADMLIEKGAGEKAFYPDSEYEAAGAKVVNRSILLEEAEVLLSIQVPEDLEQAQQNTVLVAEFAPFRDDAIVDRLKNANVRAFSLDMIPRTTLAQQMDILSSMASIAGYKAVLTAAQHLPRYFPMMITAAGSVRPAKILVLGAGVAGLQAIATARRLGAMVEAFDTRSAAKEEVKSLGAKFIEIEGATEDTGAGGYAVAQSEEFLKRQRAEVQARAMKSDVIITTAQVRGRKAPLLVPKSTVDAMRPGSIIVDLAASTGGNCELTEDNTIVVHNGVSIIGNSNLAGQMAQDASLLYSNNLVNFLKIWIKEGALDLDMSNEIIESAFITK